MESFTTKYSALKIPRPTVMALRRLWNFDILTKETRTHPTRILDPGYGIPFKDQGFRLGFVRENHYVAVMGAQVKLIDLIDSVPTRASIQEQEEQVPV